MFGKYSRSRVYYNYGLMKLSSILNPKRNLKRNVWDKVKPRVLIISHKDQQCGIYQYGVNIARALHHSKKYDFIYYECDNKWELNEAVKIYRPSAIIYNYYIYTMSWLNSWITHSYPIPQLGIMHEVFQKEADTATNKLFDYHLCPDPTLIERNPITFKTPRLIPDYINTKPIPEIPTIGSFGFGSGDKGFESLIKRVQNEFDRADIHILMPFNDILDCEGTKFTLDTAEQCRKEVYKSGINLHISHEFLSKNELLDFLASNTANAFLYDIHRYKGISSTIEYALAVHRPVIINKCGMFRHIFNTKPSICIEDASIKKIISDGITPLLPFYNEWTQNKFIQRYEQIIDEVLK